MSKERALRKSLLLPSQVAPMAAVTDTLFGTRLNTEGAHLQRPRKVCTLVLWCLLSRFQCGWSCLLLELMPRPDSLLQVPLRIEPKSFFGEVAVLLAAWRVICGMARGGPAVNCVLLPILACSK